MSINANVGALWNVMPVVLLHWLAYSLASLLIIIVCSKLMVSSSSIFSIKMCCGCNLTACLLTIAIASAAGIPPFLGFWSKTILLILIGKYCEMSIIVACWAIAVSALLFYINALRYTVAISCDTSALIKVAEYSQISYVIAIFLVLGVFFLNDSFVLCSLIFNK